jgi:LmeA-like phospholipid-binding
MVLRWVRRIILFWILFLAGLLVAADFGARVIAQYLVARQLQTSLSLQDRPKVSFGGWPFLPELVGGNIASVTVEAHGALTADSFPTESVDATMQDVQFSFGDLVSGGGQQIEAQSGQGTVTMTQKDVNSAIPTDAVTVELQDGKVLLRSDQVKGSVTATIRISDGKLVLDSDKLLSISVALPQLADGLTFTDVTVSADHVVLTFELKNASFQT